MKRAWIARPEPGASAGEAAAEHQLPRKRGGPRILIGRREWLALPELGVAPVNAKVDTGALSSSLHAESVTPFERDGQAWVSFATHNHYGQLIACEALVVRRKRVRSSSGIARERFFIETLVVAAGGLERRVELSLADRSEMKCPMLVGRRTLAGIFLVDPQSSHLLGGLRDLVATKSRNPSR
jgi:ribosomal protein S6--L-glutamate ligase